MMWVGGVVATLAWGALAFGAVYSWTYAPLLVACGLLGVSATVAGRASVPRGLAVSLCAVAACASLQLLPLSERTVAMLSPNALNIHQQRDLIAATGGARGYTLSIDAQQTALGVTFAAVFSIFLIGSVRFLTRETASRLAAGIAAIGVLVAMAGLVQRATSDYKIYGFWEPLQRSAPFGPFVNRNHFAGWMLMALPLTIGLLVRIIDRGSSSEPPTLRVRATWLATPQGNKAVLAGFAVLIMAMSLVLTLSRSGIASMACAMAFAAAVIATRPGPRRQRLAIPLYLAGVLVISILWVGFDRIGGRFAAPGLIDSAGRRAIWSAAAQMARDFPVSGTGLNTFGVASLYYQTSFTGVHVREAHNDYVQLAAEGGLLLGIPIVAAMATLIAAARRRLAIDQGSIWWVRIGAVTGLLAIAGQSLVEFSLQIPGNAALFAVLCAIALHDSGRRARRVTVAAAEEAPSTDRLWSSQSDTSAGKVVHIAAGDRPLSLAFDEGSTNTTDRGRADVKLSSLDQEPPPARRPAKFPFNAGVYYDARRRGTRQPAILGATLLAMLLFFLWLLWLFGGAAPLQ